jgi:hypothetical protein
LRRIVCRMVVMYQRWISKWKSLSPAYVKSVCIETKLWLNKKTEEKKLYGNTRKKTNFKIDILNEFFFWMDK